MVVLLKNRTTPESKWKNGWRWRRQGQQIRAHMIGQCEELSLALSTSTELTPFLTQDPDETRSPSNV